MKIIAILLLVGLAMIAIAEEEQIQVQVRLSETVQNGFRVSFQGPTALNDLHLTPAAPSSLLSPDIQVLRLDSVDEATGQVQYDRWMPSTLEIASAHAFHIDSKSNSVVRVHHDPESGQHRLNGILNGVAISHNGNEHVFTRAQELSEQKMDFINLGRNLTTIHENEGAAPRVTAIVELMIVCDKEFGDLFAHNRQRILDYWTVYMYDVNRRYATLTSDAVSFRVNGILIIGNIAGQPFIEQARGPDGRAEFGRILDLYTYWVYQQMNSWPAFDLAPLVTNTALEWGGGLAYMSGACWVHSSLGRHFGTGVWNDGGTWGSLTVGAHELGHNMGAPHDDDADYPGGCSERGYIMAGATDQLRWYFSSCSDRTVSNFVRSSEASCLQRLDGTPILDPSYSNPLAPDMTEQCQRYWGSSAYVEEADKSNCLYMRCVFFNDGGWWVQHIPPVDNTICTGGRCFRGSCRPVSSRLQ